MRRADLIDLGLVTAAGGVALLGTTRDGSFIITLLFTWVMWTLLGLVLRQGVETALAVAREQHRLRSLEGIDPTEVARQAAALERASLADDVDRTLRETLSAIRAELEDIRSSADPRPGAERIHDLARAATSELRRQLGLMRESDVPATVNRKTDRPLGWPDWAPAAVAALLAAFESAPAFLPAADQPVALSWWSVPLTVAAAALVIGRRVAPATAALLVAALGVAPRLAFGTLLASGAWMVITVGGLIWTLAARGPRDRPALLAALALAGAMAWGRYHDDPSNAGITVTMSVVAWLGGLVVGRNRRRHAATAARAHALAATLDEARSTAAKAERLTVARELHDVVSHAVGVIAMQSAAAGVSWPQDPDATLEALATIDRAAADALAELDRVTADTPLADGRDLGALVQRVRAAGTPVVLLHAQRVPDMLDGVVYRVVQESLTNALRHAPSAPVEVSVTTVGTEVRVHVADIGPGPSAASTTRGFGLAGLKERVDLAGGSFQAGPRENGPGFAVDVRLPLPSTTEVD